MPDQKDTGAQEGAEKVEKKPETPPAAVPAPAPAAPDFTPPLRRGAKDFIIERKTRQLKKAKEEAKSNEDGDGGDDDGEAQEDEEKIDKHIQKHLEPLEQGMRSQADEQELRDLFGAHPEAKELEDGIRKYMGHPAYRDVSLEVIYFGLAGRLGKLGNAADAAKKKADEDAAADRLGGSPRRPKEDDGKLPDFSKMTNAEFIEWEKKNNRPS